MTTPEEMLSVPNGTLTEEQNEKFKAMFLHWSQEARLSWVTTEVERLKSLTNLNFEEKNRRRKLQLERDRLLSMVAILDSERNRTIAENKVATVEAEIKAKELRATLEEQGKAYVKT